MAATPHKTYRFKPETLQLVEAMRRKLGEKYETTVIELAIKRLAQQVLEEKSNLHGFKPCWEE